jgi:N,N'-diacetyl-8-epilegionaminate cytidylyltransferase
MKPYVVGVICARGGSKGVPRKNIRMLAGKPLIAYAIDTARASKLIDRIIVSTDDEEIARIARKCGAEVPFMRPVELARDDSPEWSAWQHAIRTFNKQPDQRKMDVIVSIPATSPLRRVEDVDACIRELITSSADIVVTVTPANRNPYYNMVEVDEDGFARLAIQKENMITSRQTAPKVYDMTTVAYAANTAFVLSGKSQFDGKVRTVVIPRERALDIDTEYDFELAEHLIHKRAL